MTVESCIWCGSTPAVSLEHIAPDALGCPPNFVLRTGVCKSCNSKNGRLDRALLVPFEIITVLKGVLRKKNRRPTIDGFASIASSYDENGPVLFTNREKFPIITPDGKSLMGTNKSDPIKDFAHRAISDKEYEIKYSQELRFTVDTVRALFKIALESVAFFQGLEEARLPRYDKVRAFVKEGNGNFRALIMSDNNKNYDHYYNVAFSRPGFEPMVGMTILGIGFVCDFDPQFKGGKLLLSESRNHNHNAQVIPNWPKSLWVANNDLRSDSNQ